LILKKTLPQGQGKFKQGGLTSGRRNDRHTGDKYFKLELERGSDITKYPIAP
jgi:hypothetical protein